MPGQYQVKLPDGTYGVFDFEGEKPTRIEYDRDLKALEERNSNVNMDKLAVGQPSPGAIGSQPATMQASSDEDVLRRAATSNAAFNRSVQGAPAETTSNKYSAGGAIAGGIGGGLLVNVLTGGAGAPTTPAAILGGQVIGSAVGAGVGKLAGYARQSLIPGQGSPEDFNYQFTRSLEASKNDAMMNLAMSGLGAGGRLASRTIGTRALADRMFGLNTPETRQMVEDMRQVGLRAVPLDVGGKWANLYAKVVSTIPFLSGPIRTQQAARAVEIKNVLGRFIGPLESGMNEVALGRNMLSAAKNAGEVRKDWYQSVYKAADDYLEAHPNIQISNDALDPARKYLYEKSQSAVPIARTTTSDTVSKVARQFETTGRGFKATQELGQARTPFGERSIVGGEKNVAGQGFTTGESTSNTAVSRTTTRSELSGGINNPVDVDKFIQNMSLYPDKLTYPQYKQLTEDIGTAMDNASPNQKRYLAQMLENLDTSVENVDDAGAKQLIQRSRALYHQVMEFFENPQAKMMVDVDSSALQNVGGLRKPINTIDKKVPSQLFGMLFDNQTPEGLRNVAKTIGPDNMKYAVERDIARKFNTHLTEALGSSQHMNWNALRGEFGLNEPGSAQYDATKSMLKLGQYGTSMDDLKRTIDVLEKSAPDTLPPLVNVWLRSVSLGGPKALVRNFSMLGVAEGMKGALSWPGTVGLLLGLNRVSKFLVDQNRMTALNTAADLAKPLGLRQASIRQVLRYAASDIAYETKGGRPSDQEVQREYDRLVDTVQQYGQQTGDTNRGEMTPNELRKSTRTITQPFSDLFNMDRQ